MPPNEVGLPLLPVSPLFQCPRQIGEIRGDLLGYRLGAGPGVERARVGPDGPQERGVFGPS